MNQSSENDKIEDADHLEFLEWVIRYQDGSLSSAEIQKLANVICDDPVKRKLFQQVQLRSAAIHDILRMDAYGGSGKLQEQKLDESVSLPDSPPQAIVSRCNPPYVGRSSLSLSSRRICFFISLAVVSILVVIGFFVERETQLGRIESRVASSLSKEAQVILNGEVRAKFFDQVIPATGRGVELCRDYMLQSGIVELKFPSGATTIIEAPSIFQIATTNRLILSTGACSVHAPPGAEGFEVITPVTKVVDRGTRFFVKVQDNNEAEVHVLEGAADLYSTARPPTDLAAADLTEPAQGEQQIEFIKLTNGEAARIGGFNDEIGLKAGFDPKSYRFKLPDRLVRYQASSSEKVSVDELVSITVQRNGRLQDYSVEELIPIEVTWFRADSEPEPNGYMSGFRIAPNHPAELLEDRSLVTGLINFGGQPLPLDHVSVVKSRSGAVTQAPPGLGIRFRKPVVNHAGPDMVLFELQMFANPLDGDPFHVYPVSNRIDLKPLTVTKFDLTMNSPSLRKLTTLWSHRFPNAADSLEDLKSSKDAIKVDVSHSHFRVIGVGIDFSDLGYSEGEEVEELFFQHAATGNASKVDPVFLAGLPPLKTGD